jgi:hypothetical protein
VQQFVQQLDLPISSRLVFVLPSLTHSPPPVPSYETLFPPLGSTTQRCRRVAIHRKHRMMPPRRLAARRKKSMVGHLPPRTCCRMLLGCIAILPAECLDTRRHRTCTTLHPSPAAAWYSGRLPLTGAAENADSFHSAILSFGLGNVERTANACRAGADKHELPSVSGMAILCQPSHGLRSPTGVPFLSSWTQASLRN